jgi:hypothetical protein
MVIKLHVGALYGSQKKQELMQDTTLTDLLFISGVDSVYCAVRIQSLYKTDVFNL